MKLLSGLGGQGQKYALCLHSDTYLNYKRILVFGLADVEILLACFGLLCAFLDWY